jgi:hypothetical protein
VAIESHRNRLKPGVETLEDKSSGLRAKALTHCRSELVGSGVPAVCMYYLEAGARAGQDEWRLRAVEFRLEFVADDRNVHGAELPRR